MKQVLRTILIGLVTVLVTATSFAQPDTSPAPARSSVSPTPQIQSQEKDAASSTSDASAGSVAMPAYLTPIAGYQGVLAETLDGATIASQAVDEKFNPASAVKLGTALAALKSFGPDHRFITSIWASGTVDRATGTLNGDLIITGRDPSFHHEHAIMLARQLNDLGIKAVSGNLIVAPGFTMNFNWSALDSGEEFLDALDAATRSGSATRAWLNERLLLGDKHSLSSVPSVMVAGEVFIGSAPPEAKPIITRKSSKLVDVLKVLLCYSNNFMAERIGETMGGPQAVTALLVKSLKINPDEIYLATTSGLGANRLTPRAMMAILRGLSNELRKHRLSLVDVMPVAGIDPGTLEDRYTDVFSRGSVVAKTGTLIRTDGGVSSLVGQMNTKSGRVVLFVILNHHGSVVRFRYNQDAIVAAIQNTLGGPAPIPYKQIQMLKLLADSDYDAAKARGEVEPREQQ